MKCKRVEFQQLNEPSSLPHIGYRPQVFNLVAINNKYIAWRFRYMCSDQIQKPFAILVVLCWDNLYPKRLPLTNQFENLKAVLVFVNSCIEEPLYFTNTEPKVNSSKHI